MTTLLPRDSDNFPIPALRLKDSGAHTIAASATAARNSMGFGSDTQIISIYATTPVFIKTGDSTVAATTSDHYFPAGVYYDIAIGNERSGHDTHISVLAESGSGSVYISEKV